MGARVIGCGAALSANEITKHMLGHFEGLWIKVEKGIYLLQ